MSNSLWALTDFQLRARLEHARTDLAFSSTKVHKLSNALHLLAIRLEHANEYPNYEHAKKIERLIADAKAALHRAQVDNRLNEAIVRGLEDELIARNPPRNPIARNRLPVHRPLGYWERQEKKVHHD